MFICATIVWFLLGSHFAPLHMWWPDGISSMTPCLAVMQCWENSHGDILSEFKKKKPVSSLCLQNLRRRMSHYQYLEKFWFDVKKKKSLPDRWNGLFLIQRSPQLKVPTDRSDRDFSIKRGFDLIPLRLLSTWDSVIECFSLWSVLTLS